MIMFLKYLRGRVSQIGVIIQMLGIKKKRYRCHAMKITLPKERKITRDG